MTLKAGHAQAKSLSNTKKAACFVLCVLVVTTGAVYFFRSSTVGVGSTQAQQPTLTSTEDQQTTLISHTYGRCKNPGLWLETGEQDVECSAYTARTQKSILSLPAANRTVLFKHVHKAG